MHRVLPVGAAPGSPSAIDNDDGKPLVGEPLLGEISTSGGDHTLGVRPPVGAADDGPPRAGLVLLREKNRSTEISGPGAKKVRPCGDNRLLGVRSNVDKAAGVDDPYRGRGQRCIRGSDDADVALDDPGRPVFGVGDDVDVTRESKSREHSGLRSHGCHDGDVIDSDVENRFHIPTLGREGLCVPARAEVPLSIQNLDQ